MDFLPHFFRLGHTATATRSTCRRNDVMGLRATDTLSTPDVPDNPSGCFRQQQGLHMGGQKRCKTSLPRYRHAGISIAGGKGCHSCIFIGSLPVTENATHNASHLNAYSHRKLPVNICTSKTFSHHLCSCSH